MSHYHIWQDRTGAGGWRFSTDGGRPKYAATWREAWARVEARLSIKQTRRTP